MWRVMGKTEAGSWEDAHFVDLRDEITRAAVRDAVGNVLPAAAPYAEALLRELKSEEPLVGIDGVDRWGSRAVELIERPPGVTIAFGQIGETDDGLQLLGLSLYEGIELEAVAFHSPEAIVADVSGYDELEVVDADGVTAAQESTDFPEQRTVLECRLYLGAGTHVAEEEVPFEDGPDGGPRRARLRLHKAPGVLIGRILRWLGRPQKPSVDHSFPGRLKHFEQRYPEIAGAYPDLGQIAGARAPADARPGPTLVFLHGTFSCAVPSLALLDPLGPRTFRFEHDTFQSVAVNADELVQAVRARLRPDPLHLVGHSRGGLVARLAARDLAQDGDVVVRTYGTPHLGTPLANAGSRLFSALLSMGRIAAGGVFAWDPASLAMKWLLRTRELPEGIAVMRTDSQALKFLRAGREPFELMSYGGVYDWQRYADGYSAYTRGLAMHEAHSGKPNDVVVALESAQGAGERRPVPGSCDHFQYFCVEALRDELRSLS